MGTLVAAAVATALPALAEAKKYRVRIDSRPKGATVTLGSGEVLGKTPLRTRLSRGSHVIIIKREGYVEAAETINVNRRNRRFRYRLERAETGKVKVVARGSAALEGAAIFVDGEQVGRLPDSVAVEVGYRQVEVKKDGFTPFDDWVTVEAGETVTVRADMTPDGSGPSPADTDDEEDLEDLDEEIDEDGDEVAALDEDGDEDDGGSVTEAVGEQPERSRGSLASLRLGVDFGGRVFRYRNPQTANLRPYEAFGVPIGRVAADLYPLGFTSSAIARAFGLTARVGLAAPLSSDAQVGDQAESVSTTWSDYALGARVRFPVTSGFQMALAGTWGRTQFNFEDEGTMVEGEVPDVSYTEIAVGLDIEARVGARSNLLVGGRFFLLDDFGELAERFEIASSLGLGGVARLDVRMTSLLDLVLQASYRLVSMDLAMRDPAFVAEGGTDHYLGAMLGLGVSL